MDECRQIKRLDNREGNWPDNLYQEMCPERYVDERQRLLIVALLWAIMQFERPDNSESVEKLVGRVYCTVQGTVMSLRNFLKFTRKFHFEIQSPRRKRKRFLLIDSARGAQHLEALTYSSIQYGDSPQRNE